MFKTILKVAVFLGFVAYLVFALVRLNPGLEHRECRGLDITILDPAGTGFLDENEVRELLVQGNHYPEGEPLSGVNLAELESVLVACPYIDEALCYQTVEDKIALQVTPRVPVLHVLNSSGDDFYIDNRGGTMPRAHHTADLIVMTGNVPRTTAGGHYAPMGVMLAADDFWSSQIQEIHVTDAGEMEVTPRVGDHIILLGDTADLADKLQRMKTFYTEGLDRAGWNLYQTINLKFRDQVICTRRNS